MLQLFTIQNLVATGWDYRVAYIKYREKVFLFVGFGSSTHIFDWISEWVSKYPPCCPLYFLLKTL